MRLERASAKAVQYAVLNFHYTKAVPTVQVAYAVFNGAGEWCGVICYSLGANSNIAKPYGMKQGQVAELVRVALNGKQDSTSKAVGLSMKLLSKGCPLIQMLVSYADTGQDHIGTIYQATNWVFTGKCGGESAEIDPATGRACHRKTIHAKYGHNNGFERVKKSDKLKYIYPLTKSAKAIAETLRKPYPKKPTPAPEAQTDERLSSTQEAGGSIPTPALTYSLP